MKSPAVILAALAVAPSVLAHTVWSVLYVDGVSQGDGAAIRMREDPKLASYPLEDYSSDDMACNVDGTKGVNFVSSIPDGSTLTFEMRSWPGDPSKIPLDTGHAGPCAVYLKKVSSAIHDTAAGDGWFKLMDDGYDASTKQWCTDRLIANHGRLSVALPKGLEGGYYLARPEVVALHNATNGGAQFYTGCAQIFLQGTGDLVPESTIAIPGPEYVTAGQSSVKFNIYVGKNDEYHVPGPAVANFTTKTSGINRLATNAQTTQGEGVVPSDCLAQNANWCGKEVASYSDEAGCWASGEACWTQGKACWAQAPPTGGAVCELWNSKCQGINDACSAKDFNGPPEKGKVLTPKRQKIDIGLVIAPVGGGHVDEESAPEKSSEPASASGEAAENTPSPSPPVAATPKETEAPYATPAPAVDNSFIQTPSFLASKTLLSFSQGEYVLPSPAPSPAPEKSSISVPAAETPSPPETTAAASDGCPEGYKCETKYHVHVVTETKYVTILAGKGGYKRHARAHGR